MLPTLKKNSIHRKVKLMITHDYINLVCTVLWQQDVHYKVGRSEGNKRLRMNIGANERGWQIERAGSIDLDIRKWNVELLKGKKPIGRRPAATSWNRWDNHLAMPAKGHRVFLIGNDSCWKPNRLFQSKVWIVFWISRLKLAIQSPLLSSINFFLKVILQSLYNIYKSFFLKKKIQFKFLYICKGNVCEEIGWIRTYDLRGKAI